MELSFIANKGVRGEIPLTLYEIKKLKSKVMNTGTLIEVVAMIDARIEKLRELRKSGQWVHDAVIYEFTMLKEHLQKGIEADIAAMESNTGE